MALILFWIFAVVMLAFGIGIVLHRDPVSSAMCMVMTFVGLAAMFCLLDAYFIGIIQILVYAGAVMVLFLFIIMLLDIKAERARRINVPAYAGGVLVIATAYVLINTLVDIASWCIGPRIRRGRV